LKKKFSHKRKNTDNLESNVIGELKKLKANKELGKIKYYPIHFILLTITEDNTDSIQEQFIKLIKDDKITIFGVLYSKLSNKVKEHVDGFLEDKDYFSTCTVGLPE